MSSPSAPGARGAVGEDALAEIFVFTFRFTFMIMWPQASSTPAGAARNYGFTAASSKTETACAGANAGMRRPTCDGQAR